MKILNRITSLLCASAMLFSCSGIHACAAEEDADGKRLLPSGKQLRQLVSEYDSVLNPSDGDCNFGATAIGVFQGDEVLNITYGSMTDFENRTPTDENTVFEWGSITKTLVWVSAMQLWEQGKLDLEHDIRDYLPEGFFRHLQYDEPITMLNLMNHTGGWQETTRPVWKKDENEILSLHDELQEAEPVQIFRPGEVAAYSNYGAAVAGYVVECISGMDFTDYVHANIFEPLGMEHTAVNAAHSDNAWVYEQRKKMHSYAFGASGAVDLKDQTSYVTIYPAGAAAGTLTDLMTFAQALVKDDTPLFQNPETQKELFTGTDFYADTDMPVNAHGFWCNELGVRTYGHNGGTVTHQSNMLIDLESKTGFVVMIAQPSGMNWAMNIAPLWVFGERSPEQNPAGTVTPADFKGYYLPARSIHHGILRIYSFLSANSGDVLNGQHFVKTENGIYQQESDSLFNQTRKAVKIFGAEKHYADGSEAIEVASGDFIPAPAFLFQITLLALYFMLAIGAVYLLRIRYKLKKAGRAPKYTGSGFILASQIAWLVSIIALLTASVFFSSHFGGITLQEGTILGIIQIICMIVCAAGIAAAVISICKNKSKAHFLRCILSASGNIIAISAILHFELYRFWVS